jgi:hypothetical protein
MVIQHNTHLSVLRSIKKPARGELSRVASSGPDRARKWVPRGRYRVVSDGGTAKIVRQLNRAGAIPPRGRVERTFRRSEVVWGALSTDELSGRP